MIIRPYEAAWHDQGVASLTKPALRHSQSLRCVTHKACVVSLTKPALRHSQSLRCVTHKACVVCEPLGRVSSPRREGCLPRGGKGVFLEAGRVSSSRREECLPRCGEMDSLHRTHVGLAQIGSGFGFKPLVWTESRVCFFLNHMPETLRYYLCDGSEITEL